MPILKTADTETDQEAISRLFRRLDEDAYELSLIEASEPFVVFTVRRLRRERGELHGELTVETEIAGAITYEGVLSVGDLNFSSQRARTERATYLATRAKAKDVDWRALLDEFAQRVLRAEQAGQPAVDLRTLERPAPEDVLEVEGLVLPRRHPAILFGDGGAAKSYLALYFLGCLAQKGLRVGLFDWELAGEDHRERIELVFGQNMPPIAYARCERPLVYEMDRLKRITRELSLDYVVYDSIAFACDGPPEAAEVASRYFRATRQIGPGSLHIAHVNKSDTGDQKPFGSTFWHNGARSTWFAKLSDSAQDGSVIQLGLFNRKSNLGPVRPAVGLEIGFSSTATLFRRIHLSGVPDLASKLSLPQRLRGYLLAGAKSREEIAEEFEDVPKGTLKRTLSRALERGQLLRFPTSGGEKIGLPSDYSDLTGGDTCPGT